MKRKIFRILFALVLVLSFSLVTAVPAMAATTYYVATTGNNANVGSSSGAPWLTITYAVTTASAGDTISVAAGTYNTALGETFPITISKSLTIQSSAGAATTIIDASGAVGGVHIISSNGVTFTGFTIKNVNGTTAALRPLYLYAASNCSISDVLITDCGTPTKTTDALYLYTNSTNNALTNITIQNINSNSTSAISVASNSNGNTFTSITISGLTATGGWADAIPIYGSQNNVFTNITISNVIGAQKSRGITLSGTTAKVANNNTFSNVNISSLSVSGTPLEPSIGIKLDSADGGNPSGNTFTGCGISGAQYGIRIYGNCPTNAITNSSIVGNTVYGAFSDTVSLNAKNNWWGTAVGAEIAAKVNVNVDYTPWLTSAPSSVSMTAKGQAATLPAVTTNAATLINFTVATLNGNLTGKGTSEGGPKVSFVYGMNSVSTPSGTHGGYISETAQVQQSSIGVFTATLTTLTSSQTYYFRAKAQPSDMTDPVYGAEISFITTIATTPTVTTLGVTNIGVTTATLNGRLAIGGATPVSVYLAYDTSSHSATPTTYTWNVAVPATLSANGDFAFSVTGLSANTLYYFMAKGVAGGVDYYGTELTFTTQHRIGVSVSPTYISFGDIIAGHSSTSQPVTVTNTGTPNEKFTTSLANQSPADFYSDNLKIAGVAVSAWQATPVAPAGTATPGLILSIPIGSAIGEKTATLIFWAEQS